MHTNRPMGTLQLCARNSLTILLAIGFLVFCSVRTPAQIAMEKERQKAIFLHNILTFVQWTDVAPPGSFEFCVEGDPLLGFALTRELKAATLNGAKVRVRLVRMRSDFTDCQALVLEGSDSNQVMKRLVASNGTSLITFGETDGFLQAGGVIQIIDQGGRLQFGVNLDTARYAGIRIDARLLELAKCLLKSGELTGG